MTVRSLINTHHLHEKLVALRLIHAKPLPPSSSVRVFDATVTSRSAADDFLDAHIPSANFFDLNECADKESGLTRTVPSPELFEEYVNHLGIGASSSIVAYDATRGSAGMFSAPRLWWLFRLFGHQDVAVLDGGFDKWISDGYPLASSSEHHSFVAPLKDTFRAKYQPGLRKTFDQMMERSELVQAKNSAVDVEMADVCVDARSMGEVESGSLPNVNNLFFHNLVDHQKGTLVEPKEIKQIFMAAGVDLEKPGFKFTSYCVTGTTACSLNLAAAVLGEAEGKYFETALYDGSWQEWKRHGS